MNTPKLSAKSTFLLFTFLCLFTLKAASVGYFKSATRIARVHTFSDFAYFYSANTTTAAGYTNIAKDNDGNIYIADYNANRIRKYNVTTGVYAVIAGNGSGGDGYPALSAKVDKPSAICVDSSGNIFFTERFQKNHQKNRKRDRDY